MSERKIEIKRERGVFIGIVSVRDENTNKIEQESENVREERI